MGSPCSLAIAIGGRGRSQRLAADTPQRRHVVVQLRVDEVVENAQYILLVRSHVKTVFPYEHHAAAFPQCAAEILRNRRALRRLVDPVEPVGEAEVRSNRVAAIEREDLALDVRLERVRGCHSSHEPHDCRAQRAPVDHPLGEVLGAGV